MALILAIESSCDETSVAITKDGVLLSNVINTQIEVHQKYGGVMPEIASRLHCENIALVLQEAVEKANIKLEDVDAFAVTRGPGLIGALHVGMQAAKTLALLYNKPIVPVHHLAGHIYANEFNEELKFPLLAVVVSGGNSELVLMNERNRRNSTHTASVQASIAIADTLVILGFRKDDIVVAVGQHKHRHLDAFEELFDDHLCRC